MNLKRVLQYRPYIYAFLALWIIFFHIYRRVGLPIDVPILSEFLSFGNIAVDIFLFLGGCCSYLSFDKHPDKINNYYIKRYSRILLPYFLIAMPYWLWHSATRAGGFSILRFAAAFSSATFWLRGTQTTWFVFAIAICYLIFPVVYKIIKKSLVMTGLLILLIVSLNVCACLFVPMYMKSSIAWTRLPIFILGAVAGKYIDKLDFKEVSRSCNVLCIWGAVIVQILVFFVFPINRYFQSEVLWILYAPITLFVIVDLMGMVNLGGNPKPDCTSGENKNYKISRIIGGVTLELYIIHVCLLNILDYYGLQDELQYWIYVIVPVVTIIFSLLVSRLENAILRMISKNTRLLEK